MIVIVTSEASKGLIDEMGCGPVRVFNPKWGRKFIDTLKDEDLVLAFDAVGDPDRRLIRAAGHRLFGKCKSLSVKTVPVDELRAVSQPQAGTLWHEFMKVGEPMHPDLWCRWPCIAVTDTQSLEDATLSVLDFFYHALQGHFIFHLTGAQIPGSKDGCARINKQVPPKDGEPASLWVVKNHPFVATTWYPGQPTLIKDRIYGEQGFTERVGSNTLNLYKPSSLVPGNADDAGQFVSLVKTLFPTEAEHNHILDFLAFAAQHHDEKINHMLLLGGVFGLGKDTIIQSCVPSFGEHNSNTVSAKTLTSAWTGFMECSLLTINECHDLGDQTREAFYEHLKQITATPPMHYQINKKYVPQYYVPNVTTITGTTNHLEGGIYIPPGDRRIWFGWSNLDVKWRSPADWQSYYNWLAQGGYEAVAGLLLSRDVSRFNPKAPPPMTDAKDRAIIASAYPEDAALSDVFERIEGNAMTLNMVATVAWVCGNRELAKELWSPKFRRNVIKKFARAGYIICKNPDNAEGLWRVPRQNCQHPKYMPTRKAMIYVPKTIDGRESTLEERMGWAKWLMTFGEPEDTNNEPPYTA